jgi:hypothetical protein
MKLTYFLLSLHLLSTLSKIFGAKYNFEIHNITGKSANLEVVDKLEVAHDKYRYNITALVKTSLNDIYVSFKDKSSKNYKIPNFINFAQVNSSLSMKFGNTFRTIFKLDQVEWCSLLKNINQLGKTNRFIKPLYKDIKTIAPQLLGPCPFIGDFRIINVASPENILSILPAASLLGKIRIKDKVKKADITIEIKFSKFN